MRAGQLTGALTENRFFTVCGLRNEYTPDWFLRVKNSGLAWDIRGIDAFAYIRAKDPNSKRVKIPLQIKSSKTGKRKFIQHHSDDVVKNVVVITVLSSKTDDQIRRQVYSELGRIRNAGIRYDDFFERIMSVSIPMGTKRFVSNGAYAIKKN